MKNTILSLAMVLSTMTAFAGSEGTLTVTETRIQDCYLNGRENYITIRFHSGFPDMNAVDAHYARQFLKCQAEKEGVLVKQNPKMSLEEIFGIIRNTLPRDLSQFAQVYGSIFK